MEKPGWERLWGVGEQRLTSLDARARLLDAYDRGLPRVFGYVLSRCGERSLAEDLTAETFLAAAHAVRADESAPVSTPGACP